MTCLPAYSATLGDVSMVLSKRNAGKYAIDGESVDTVSHAPEAMEREDRTEPQGVL